MRCFILAAAGGVLAGHGLAQPLIQELGGGVGLQGITFFHVDTALNDLYMCGAFAYANEQAVSPGIMKWNEDGFNSLGCGIDWDCVQPVSVVGLANPALSITQWRGDLYVGGSISFVRNGIEYSGIMRWDGANWHPVGHFDEPFITSIHVIDEELIVTGWFQYADTVEANGLARWDGERWHRVVDVPQFSPGDNNYVNDVAKFQGDWYIGGILIGMRDLARWNGSSWEQVDVGFLGPFCSVQKLHVHNDRLYVNGTFSACPPYGVPTNPGSGIVAWDGEQWDDLGGGTCGSIVPDVFATTWWNGELYATGRFTTIGGVEGSRVAKWDGEEWCMLFPPNYFSNGGPNALAIYNDSLFIGGAFSQAGPTEISCFGKWVGGDQTFGCGRYVGVEEQASATSTWSLFPSPGRFGIQHQHLPVGAVSITWFDISGRAVLETPASYAPLDLNDLAAGTYSVVAFGARQERLATTRFSVY